MNGSAKAALVVFLDAADDLRAAEALAQRIG